MKLISLKEKWYRLITSQDYRLFNNAEKLVSLYGKYVSFVNTPISSRYIVNGFDSHPLNRFIPTDKDGNVLEKPVKLKGDIAMAAYYKTLKQYQEALDRVIFKGFEIQYNNCNEFKYQSETIDIMFKNSYTIRYNCYHKSLTAYFEGERTYDSVSSIEDLCNLGLELTEAGEKTINQE